MTRTPSVYFAVVFAAVAALTFGACTKPAPGVDGSTGCDGPCPCIADTQCGGATPRCDKNGGVCVACLPLNDNCPAGSRCVASNNSYSCSTACVTAADCPNSATKANFCCNSACIDVSSDIMNCGGCGKACPVYPNAVAVCISGTCALGTCNAGFSNCDNVPTNGCEIQTANDPSNCGTCGKSCTAGQNSMANCSNGTCNTTCATGFADCAMNGSCSVNIASDPMNCGGCGMACTATPNATVGCTNATCSITGCQFGFADCDKNPANGCEANLLSIQSCGSCGNTCATPANASAGCNAGICGIGMCNPLFGDCNASAADGCEKNLAADVDNCGSCGKVCTPANATPACLGGQCGIAMCNAGYDDCDSNPANGCESNKESDPNNCGGCGTKCMAPANAAGVCANGVCSFACSFGYADCDNNVANGCETNLTVPASCGSCHNVCAVPANATAGCNMGTCGIGMCNTGYADCDGSAANGCEKSVLTDLNNCGGCNKVCAPANATAECLNGVCGFSTCKTGYADCNMNTADGCEANTNTDPKNCGGCGKACGGMTPDCANGVCTNNPCKGVVGPMILAVMGTPLYGACWYLGAPNSITCDEVCAATGGTNVANTLLNAYPDDCNGGAAGQPATWFFENANKCGWTGPTGAATGYKTLGHGYNNTQGISTYYGKCTVPAGLVADSGTFPGETNDRADRCTVCACSQ